MVIRKTAIGGRDRYYAPKCSTYIEPIFFHTVLNRCGVKFRLRLMLIIFNQM